MTKMYYISIAIIVAVFVAAMMFAGSPAYFFDPASILFLFVPVIFMMLGHYTPAEIVGCFRAAMRDSGAGEWEIRDAFVFFRTLQRSLLVVSVLGFLTGFITMAASDMNAAEFRVGFGVAILMFYYALVIMMLVTIPFSSALRRRMGGRAKM